MEYGSFHNQNEMNWGMLAHLRPSYKLILIVNLLTTRMPPGTNLIEQECLQMFQVYKVL